jgi:hypothetical protein
MVGMRLRAARAGASSDIPRQRTWDSYLRWL